MIRRQENVACRTIAMGLYSLVGACASAAPAADGAPRPGPSATAAPTTIAAPGAPVAPRLVLQTVPRGSFNTRWHGLTLSEDGTRVVFYGTTTKLVSVEDGAVRAELPQCSSSAAFSPDARSLFVVGCPEHLASADLSGRQSPEVTVVRWDLERDEVRSFAKGRFERVEVPASGGSVLLLGRDRVELRGLDDGVVKRSLSVLGQEPHELVAVAPDAERALFDADGSLLLASANGSVTKLDLRTSARPVLSTDLRHVLRTGPDKRLQLTETVGGKVAATLEIPPEADTLAFDPTDQRLAVRTNGHVAIVDRAGKLQCETKGSDLIRWSSDGQKLLVRQGGDAFAVVDSVDCKEVRQASSEIAARAALRTNRRLDVVGWNFGEATFPIWSQGQWRSLPVQTTPWLRDGSTGRIDLEKSSFDLADGVVKPTLQGEAIVTPMGTLSVHTNNGTVATVRGAYPEGAQGPLFFRDAQGKDTALERARPVGFGACVRSRTGAWFACSQFYKDAQLLGIWDAKGRWKGEVSGTYASFSGDDSRMLVEDNNISATRLFDTATLRELYVDHGAHVFRDTEFGDGDALISWNATGVVDAKTGKVLWGTEETDVVGWLRGPPLRVIERTSTVTVERDAGAYDNRGPLRILDGRSGKVLHAFDVDVEIVDQAKDGSILLTRDALDGYRLRDGATYAEIAALGTWSDAWLDPTARFVTRYDHDAFVTRRLADGTELVQVPTATPGQRGLAFTRDGHFDGDAEALALLRRREGSPLDGTLQPVGPNTPGYRPRLVADFWAGKSVAP